jgi:hypothetical protein
LHNNNNGGGGGDGGGGSNDGDKNNDNYESEDNYFAYNKRRESFVALAKRGTGSFEIPPSEHTGVQIQRQHQL